MFLRQLSLIQFKNYDEISLQFSEKINCFVGDNGVGKTNLLDSIYYLSMCKSYFNSVDSQLIKHEKDFFVIQGTYERNELDEHIYCGIKRNARKQFKRNKKDYEKLSEHIGLLPVVMVSPSDSALVQEGSEERRRFLDSVISQYDKQYLDDLIRYNRVLQQRNRFLKDLATQPDMDSEMLEAYDVQLAQFGTRIYKARFDFIEKLLPIFNHYYQYISEQAEEVQLHYVSQLSDAPLIDLLAGSRKRDRALEYTSVGIHKDDMDMLLGAYPIKRLGSQGQQKTYLIALKLSQFDFMKQINGFEPILLLDDLFDKLDQKRVANLIQLVSENHFGQIFITDTGKSRLQEIVQNLPIAHAFFDIERNGIITSI